ncbi:hypothetical protein [Salinigranum rubrum]|uniref:hypothetical protein n=1 Tax=Salinigranum rubrum TaxID=755307 RepID=UPI0013A57C95|nr:hypothetical protein [Salinigranum rubrum]
MLKEHVPDRHAKNYFVLKFVSFLLFGVSIAAYILFRFTGLDVAEVLQAISIVVSILLTGALIVLYRDLSVIQGDQVKIMEASYTPIVGITGWEIAPDVLEDDPPEPFDRLRLTLSNQGNSLACDLRVMFAIAYDAEKLPFEVCSKEVPVNRVKDQFWWHSDMGGVLPEDTTEVDFYTTPTFLLLNEDGEEMIRFDEVVEKLAKADVEEARLALSLRYQNAAGDEAEIDFATFNVDIERCKERDSRLKYAKRGALSSASGIREQARTVE